jgi:glycosyltransferase involved in cell wall biosynthesis
MWDGKIIIARFWPKFDGNVPSIIPVILGLNPQKYETIIIYLTKNSDTPNILEQNRKNIFFVTQKPKLPFFKPIVFSKLFEILKSQKVDILHCHHHKATFYGTIAGKLAKVPIILDHVHGMGRTRNFNRKLLNRFLLPHVDKILAVSQTVKNDILQNNPTVNPEKVISIGNSIDYDYFASTVYDKYSARKKFGIPENSFVFGTAGRLAPTKGQKYLIKAFSQVKKRSTNAELLIAGTGWLQNKIERQASKENRSSFVHFLGYVDNMLEFYSAVDTFVLPSVAEGLPRTLMEAMAAGILCIATKAGGVPELLDNGRYGLLVPSKDTNVLADAMLKTINMPQQEKEAIISTAKKHIKKNYNHNAMIKKTEKIYNVLVAEKIG